MYKIKPMRYFFIFTKAISILFLLIIISTSLYAQTDKQNSFVLFGNLASRDSSTIDYALHQSKRFIPETNKVRLGFLGNFVRKSGFPVEHSKHRKSCSSNFRSKLDLFDSNYEEVFLIPGINEWKNGGHKGWNSVLELERYVTDLYLNHEYVTPSSGCPGPEEININEHLTIVTINTQYFLHEFSKPSDVDGCGASTLANFTILLDDILKRNTGKHIFILAHHPVISDSKYSFTETLSFDSQNPLSAIRADFNEIVTKTISQYDNIVYFSGEEPNFQHHKVGNNHFISVGSLCQKKNLKSKSKRQSVFAINEYGYSQLDEITNGQYELSYYGLNDSAKIYSFKLDKIAKPTTPKNNQIRNFPDSIVMKGSDMYTNDNGLYLAIMGKNYRKEWNTDIKVPVIDLSKEKGGLKVIQRGGGNQTLSLRLQAPDGKQYVLRSVEKDPEAAVPPFLRGTIGGDIVQDQISSSHPYSALVVPKIADAANIYHTNPSLVFLPDDPLLGDYQEQFANKLYLFEERPAGNQEEADFFGNSKKVYSTPKMLVKLYKDNDNHVDQNWVVKSRLVDIFLADWDRHDDQWRWASFKEKKGTMFRPVPRDRDQVFFINNGILPYIVSRKWGLSRIQGFDDEFDWVPGFSFNARNFDRHFTNEMTLEDWTSEAEKLQKSLTDDVLIEALKAWPQSIQNLSSEVVLRKLKSQRDHLVEYARQHYEFISKEVHVIGSNKKELIEVTRNENGSVLVELFKLNKKEEKGKKIYSREFEKGITKEVRIYGLDGDDKFVTRGVAKKSITIRQIGGRGNDTFIDQSKVGGFSRKTIVYDTKEGNTLESTSETKDKTSNKENINEFVRQYFIYDKLMPLISLGVNPDEGLTIGGGFIFTNQGFRKENYKTKHSFLGNVAITTGGYDLTYKLSATDVIGPLDLELEIGAEAPNVTDNFFGLGNNSIFNNDLDISFYRTRKKVYDFNPQLKYDYKQKHSVIFGPTLKMVEIEENEGRFISDFNSSGVNPSIISEKTLFTGFDIGYDYINIDNLRMPTRGIHFNIKNTYTYNSEDNSSLNKLNSSLSLYLTPRTMDYLTFAVRSGGGINSGDWLFYQGQVLGSKSGLRGYRQQRFYGDRSWYSNAELRIRLGKIKSHIFPGKFGIVVFGDAGRVWLDGETSDTLNKSAGGGLWMTPFEQIRISFYSAKSTENLYTAFQLGYYF